MTDEKTAQMNINIGKRVRLYLCLFAGLMLLLVWSQHLTEFVNKALAGDKDTADLGGKIVESVVILVSSIGLMIVNLGRDVDLHNLLDRKLFHVRRRTGQIIHNQLMAAACSVNARGSENMANKEKEVMYLFYHFANKQEELRKLAFTYWEQYFVNIYTILFSGLAFLGSVIIITKQRPHTILVVVPVLLLCIAVGVSIQTKCSLVKKIYDLPRQQIEEIRVSNGQELREQVEARFAKKVTLEE